MKGPLEVRLDRRAAENKAFGHEGKTAQTDCGHS
jgi:hypothetical protein